MPKSARELWAATIAVPAPITARQRTNNQFMRSRIKPPQNIRLDWLRCLAAAPAPRLPELARPATSGSHRLYLSPRRKSSTQDDDWQLAPKNHPWRQGFGNMRTPAW